MMNLTRNWWLIVVRGLLAILVITLMIGAYALAFGVLLVFLGFRLRRWDIPPRSSDRGPIQSAR